MLLIPCPWCGPRDETEFPCGGEAHIARPDRPDRVERRGMGRLPLHAQQPEGRASRALGARARLRALVQRRARHGHPRDPRRLPSWASRRRPPRARRMSAAAFACRRAAASTARGRSRFTLRRPRATRAIAGDTLASALLANGVHLVGAQLQVPPPARHLQRRRRRSRTRWCSSSAAARTEPNARATEVELYDGLDAPRARTAGRRSASTSARVNDLLSPLFPAGFYYKTFMWPPRCWMTSTSTFIRRAAGLGRAPREPDPDRYEHALRALRRAGGRRAGRPGIAAALAAGRSGRARDPGRRAGRARRLAARRATSAIDGAPATRVARTSASRELRGAARGHACCRARPPSAITTTTIVPARARRRSPAAPPRGACRASGSGRCARKQVVLATGAIERPLVFAGNDRPGHHAGLAPSRPTSTATPCARASARWSSPTTTAAYARGARPAPSAGVAVAAVVDLRATPTAACRDEAACARASRSCAGHAVVAHRRPARASSRVEVTPMTADGSASPGAAARIACDLVCDVGRLEPDRASLLAVAAASCATTRSSPPSCPASSVPAGALGRRGAAAASRLARVRSPRVPRPGRPRREAAGFSGRAAPLPPVRRAASRRCSRVWARAAARPPSRGKRVRRLPERRHRRGPRARRARGLSRRRARQALHHDRHGHRPGQDQQHQRAGDRRRQARAARSPQVGTTTFRPPYTPVTFGALAGPRLRRAASTRSAARRMPRLARGARRACSRTSATGSAPGTTRRPGEDMHAAVAARVPGRARRRRHARRLDARQDRHPGAATRVELLNRVYTNAWAKLAVGRCRYGLMLRRGRHGVRRRRHRAPRPSTTST